MQPILSIIVPVFKVEMYIEECIDSLINQTLRELEIIFVDDCSPDKSGEIILNYAKNDNRIKYIRLEENIGQGGARNIGIENATAEWLTFVDSDDFIAYDCYKTILDQLKKNSADIAIFGVMLFNDHTKKRIKALPIPSASSDSLLKITPFNICEIPTGPCNKLYKLSDIRKHNVFFPQRLKHEDDEFTFKFLSVTEPLAFIDYTEFYKYRQRDFSTMTDLKSSCKDLPYISFNIMEFLRTKNQLEKYRTGLLKKIDEYCNSILILDSESQGNFIREMSKVLHKVRTAETDFSTLGLITQTLASTDRDKTLGGLLKRIKELESDRWYMFGQLSIRGKLLKIAKILLARLTP